MNNIPTRRERRASMKYQGILKMKSKLSFKNWRELTVNTIKAGREIFESNKDNAEKAESQQLETLESKLVLAWKDMGYLDTEIAQLREANAIITVKDIHSWHADKKTARKIMKDANRNLLSRLNG